MKLCAIKNIPSTKLKMLRLVVGWELASSEWNENDSDHSISGVLFNI